MRKQILLLALLLVNAVVFAQTINVIPKPVSFESQNGNFTLNSNTQLLFDQATEEEKVLTEMAVQLIADASDLNLKVQKPSTNALEGNIVFQLNQPFNEKIGTEGYQLEIRNDRVFLNANTTAGLYYGMQTIWQMLTASDGKTLSCGKITDYPRFNWRGMHLDVSRHFMPVDFIYKYIDYIALHKMNIFHWHLVDDQGWRIEIKKYPKLTEVGAWRADRENLGWDARKGPVKKDEPKYGGFYTQEEIKSLVAYAQNKHVTIVPEIEMPAHVMSGLAAYPEYSCTGEYIPVPSGGVWPITHIFCAGKDETFHFLENVLSEVMDLFPSTYIHIGGDEATKTEWEKCELCQNRMKEEGLENEHELQAYFIKRIEKFLNSKGRQLIGWNEILEGGLDPSATIMSWQGSDPGIKAAKSGHDVVMSPGSHCYFDHYQGDPSLEPKAWGGMTTLKKVYSFEPIPEELNEKEGQHILGAQANVWTEYIPDGKQVEYMTMPRMSALSEVLWSPAESKDWGDFSQRMETQYQRFEKLGVNYANSAFQVSADPELNADKKIISVKLSTEAWQPEIRYTIDGSEPNAGSTKYTEPFEIDKTATVKAVVVENGKPRSKALATDFFIHKAIACPVSLKYPNSKYYDADGDLALVNGIKGSINHSDGNWKGFNGDDMVATIDLGEKKSISTVVTGVLQNSGSWIFYPTEMIVEISDDGKNFHSIGRVKNKVSPDDGERQIQDLEVKKKTSTRYVRVTLKNLGTCPKGHAGEGKAAWLFADEITIE